jgi:uncharacterized protein (DUF433 family)
MKKLLAAVVAVGVLAAGATAAFADNSAPSTSAPPAAQSARARHPKLAKSAIVASAKAIGISAKDLVKELKGGKSIADVAKAHDVSTAKVVAALVAGGTNEIKTALDNGKITKERAAKLEANLPKRATAFVAKRRHLRKVVVRTERRKALAIASTTIGISSKDLVSEVKSGKTVADVATEHSVNPQKVIDAVVSAGDHQIDTLLAGNRITQDRATTLKTKLVERVTKLVNNTPHPKQAAAQS